jgi:dethiobiotin synthetase
MNGIFVTGTDTGVGKTVVAAALLKGLRARGVDAVPMKPVQTGCDRSGDALIAPDLELCLRAGNLHPSHEEKEWMCPYRFEPACSPHLAAQRAGRPISVESITGAAGRLRERHALVIVEGAGGVLVPVNETASMLDVMKALGLPILLVARPGLGTLNHSLLSVEALRRAGLSLAGIILSDATAEAPWGEIERDNQVLLTNKAGVPVMHMPYVWDDIFTASGTGGESAAWQPSLAPILEFVAHKISTAH